MGSLLFGVLIGLLWIVNLFMGTGLDEAYHVTQYARIIVISAFVVTGLLGMKKKGSVMFRQNDFFSFAFMLMIFYLSAFISGKTSEVTHYMWVFVLIYLMSKFEFDSKKVFWTAIGYGLGGLAVLLMYNYGELFKGWNENSVAMLGMHSFLVLIIPFFNAEDKRIHILMFLLAGIFGYLLIPTGARSCILFTFVEVLFAINIIPQKIVYGEKHRLTWIMLIPLFVAVLVVLIASTSLFASLDRWSYQQFNKPIFNGRDSVWNSGFEILFENVKNVFIGAGSMHLNNWHNSALFCLTAYGFLGYTGWIKTLKNIVSRAFDRLDDSIVQGCVISFVVLYLQQSVEVGFITSNPSIIAYVILGIMLGRIRFLQKTERY